MGQELLGPSYSFIPLVIGPLNSLVWYVPSLRYTHGLGCLRKDLPWEEDSITRVAHDPEHIPDCNVQGKVRLHFLFHEQIPKAATGSGYLRVATKSLWWQHEHFPKVWTLEGLTTCMENGYQWNINSTRGTISE